MTPIAAATGSPSVALAAIQPSNYTAARGDWPRRAQLATHDFREQFHQAIGRDQQQRSAPSEMARLRAWRPHRCLSEAFAFSETAGLQAQRRRSTPCFSQLVANRGWSKPRTRSPEVD